MENSVAVIYIVTAVISVLIAFFLVNQARLSAQAKTRRDRRLMLDYSKANVKDDAAIKQTVFEEISDVVKSPQLRNEISKKMSDLFTAEVEKRVTNTAQELSRQFDKVVEEKSRNEEIAWKKYKKILGEKKETEAVIRSVAEGLLVVDAEGKVVMMNPAAEKLLGVTRKNKIGKSILENLKEEQLISLARQSGDEGDREIELVSPNSETKKIVRASSAIIENENGQTVGMVSILSDITKQKELDAMKSNFVASVSHELRTPLVAVQKSITLLLSKATGQVTETQEQFLSIAERNLKRLSKMIDDLLDLSKLEAGKMELRPQPSSIENVINETVAALNTWAKTKSIEIVKKIPENLPLIDMDPDKIIQVLNNLIGNAIKFTPKDGTITVEAALNNERRQIEVSVSDTGMGIAKEDIPKIFNKFYQGKGERAPTDVNGTGIGLAIAKEIAELHNGRIWVESGKGAGAKFIFTLPCK